MKVIQSNEFSMYMRAGFPEHFAWNQIDSYKLSEVATAITNKINDDLETEDRNFVGGLRMALVEIARIADTL